MITIAIELNDVVRNFNAQLLKYYTRDFDSSLYDEDIDPINEDVLEKYVKFGSKHDLRQFLYIDYPYELYGCAKTCDKRYIEHFTAWLEDIPNHEGEEVRIIYYSLDEGELSVQSTFFFLSKIGTRVRKVIFPTSLDELFSECDVVVTANNKVLKCDLPQGKRIVAIKRGFNEHNLGAAFLVYDSITDLMNDEEFLDKIRG